MPVAACGICCDVCEFYVKGICVSCAAGTNADGVRQKQDAEIKKLGMGCPILQCASERKIAYCTRDCQDFPCEKYRTGWTSWMGPGPCPYSESWLAMFPRRRASGK